MKKTTATLVLHIVLINSVCSSDGIGAGQPFTTSVVAVSGQTSPDGNGTFNRFGNPALNTAGQAAFVATLLGTTGGSIDDRGIYQTNGGVLSQVVRAGQPVPDGNGFFSDFGDPTQNASGQLAYNAFLGGTSDPPNDRRGIYRNTGAVVTQIARDGQILIGGPNGSDPLDDLSYGPSLNNAGQVAFLGDQQDELILRGSGGPLTQIVRAEEPTPNGDMFADFYELVALNEAGQTAFQAFAFSGQVGVYVGDGTTLSEVAVAGDLAPDGIRQFEFLGAAALNNAGQLAFIADLSDFAAGIYIGDESSIVLVGGAGLPAPDGNGTLAIVGDPALNENGDVAFYSSVTGTNGGSTDNEGIFRGNGSILVQAARAGQAAPDGNGTILRFRSEPAINDKGQVVVLASLTGTSGSQADDEGLFMYDDNLGLLQVAREGDALLGSTITDLRFSDSTTGNGDERSGLNDAGQLAYHFTLADGRHGIAVATVVPEPRSVLLMAIGCAIGVSYAARHHRQRV